ncbi:dephospho-CoA kinase [Gimibacter soli]|uniref:Dephospho-CoA kinase n=1 Tax=Gimibacter soli TaxID=3024400 RepID=A0AAE9XP46_9PROT|nr:dephospho-CoA kinase [Gimibacter soli]WCL54597.1 dephospho-CoA kinase [Gimibacter soli]
MIILGLTGSIGMGKSVTADMFRALGVPVHDSDAVVHRLQAKDGKAIPAIAAAFPGTVEDGALDRQALGAAVFGNESALQRLQGIMFPLIMEDRRDFIEEATLKGQKLVVLDVPLLFETGGDKACDKVVVVTAPADVQRQRVLARPGMTPERFEKVLAHQMPDAEKRRLADFLIDTSLGMAHAEAEVRKIVERLTAE